MTSGDEVLESSRSLSLLRVFRACSLRPLPDVRALGFLHVLQSFLDI